jgi:hypothetical protein
MRKRWPRPVARATSFARLSPRFLIIGEMKCGTTSLFSHLCGHPAVLRPFKKETFFFDVHYERGVGWYRSHFPLARHARDGQITGEATAYYLFHPLARHRIHAFDPEIRLIAVLRDPVERALSHYHHARSKGREPLSFEDALDAEDERLRGESERIAVEAGYRSFSHINHSYVARGRYAEQLEEWLEVFPREQLLVLRSEDLFERPREIVNDALTFLGLPETDLTSYPALNTREYGSMSAETRARLTAYFDEPNRRLVELVGRDFNWSRPAAADASVGSR